VLILKNNFFVKSHGLGNEYLVFDADNITFKINEHNIKKICSINYGIGSDGLLLKVKSSKADFGLKIFNPDGSEAEKSGNGLRIFSKYLFDYKISKNKEFKIETKGGIVSANIKEVKNDRAVLIKVDMGKASFLSEEIPVNVSTPECIDKLLIAGDMEYIINCVSIGNPHCVVLKDSLDVSEIKKYGTIIENNKIFPNRTNVQFVRIISRNEIEILIWERGAGFTLASGSSSCAAASVMLKKGLICGNVNVKMPGGYLHIDIDDLWNIKMTGVVQQVAEGFLSDELLEDLIDDRTGTKK
jgi:diaminopimelate epimerase